MSEDLTAASAEKKAELLAAHGKLWPVEVQLKAEDSSVEFLLRAPTKQEYQLFLKGTSDKETRPSAIRKIVRPCIVWPERADLDLILDRSPGMLESLGDPVLEIAGMVRVELGKALVR